MSRISELLNKINEKRGPDKQKRCRNGFRRTYSFGKPQGCTSTIGMFQDRAERAKKWAKQAAKKGNTNLVSKHMATSVKATKEMKRREKIRTGKQ